MDKKKMIEQSHLHVCMLWFCSAFFNMKSAAAFLQDTFTAPQSWQSILKRLHADRVKLGVPVLDKNKNDSKPLKAPFRIR